MLNLKNKLSKERSDLVEISLHSTYEGCLLYLTLNPDVTDGVSAGNAVISVYIKFKVCLSVCPL